MRLLAPALLLLLSGCFGGGGDPDGGPPGVDDAEPRPPPVAVRVLLDEPFQATPAGAATFTVGVPADAHNVTVQVRVDAAAGSILDVSLEGCGSYSVTTNVVVQPRTFEDTLCPKAEEGPKELRIGGEGGAFTGSVQVAATVPGA